MNKKIDFLVVLSFLMMLALGMIPSAPAYAKKHKENEADKHSTRILDDLYKANRELEGDFRSADISQFQGLPSQMPLFGEALVKQLKSSFNISSSWTKANNEESRAFVFKCADEYIRHLYLTGGLPRGYVEMTTDNYRIVCDESNNGLDVIKAGKIHLDIYYRDGAVGAEDFSSLPVNIAVLIDDLVNKGYIDKYGVVQEKVAELKSFEELTLDPAFDRLKIPIYKVLTYRLEQFGKTARFSIDLLINKST